jgi:galactokinase
MVEAAISALSASNRLRTLGRMMSKSQPRSFQRLAASVGTVDTVGEQGFQF